jgi:hypothetical protein
VIAPLNLKKTTHINNLKLNLHAQENPISAQVVGGSGLSPPRASIGILSLSLSQPSLMMMTAMTENHMQQQQQKSELQLLLFSWSFGYI